MRGGCTSTADLPCQERLRPAFFPVEFCYTFAPDEKGCTNPCVPLSNGKRLISGVIGPIDLSISYDRN